MLLKQKSLFLVFVAHVVFGAAGYIMEDGKSPPMTLKKWLPEKNFRRMNGRSQSGFIAQRAQSMNFNVPVRQPARTKYFDSYSTKQTPATNRNAHMFRLTQETQHAMNLPHQARGTYKDSYLFHQVDQVEGRNFVDLFQIQQPSRTPFEQHEIIDARSPISKRDREQNLFTRNNDENHGLGLEREVNGASFEYGGIRDNLHQLYQRTPVNRRQSNRYQRGRDHFVMQQNHAHIKRQEFDDYEPDYFREDRDYSTEFIHEGNEEEIRYESPFSDEGASNDQIDEYYDFFSNQEAFKDNVRYYSVEMEGDPKTNIFHPADVEVDFANAPDFSAEETRAKDTHELSVIKEPTRLSLDSFEVDGDNSFTNEKNPVRSLEAMESQEYSNKKIKTIYRVSRGKDKGGIYPVITSVRTHIEDIAAAERKGKNLQVSPQPTGNRKSFETTVSEEKEHPSRTENRRVLEVGPSRGLQDSKYSQQIENNQDKGKRAARHIKHHHVPGYTKHGPEHVHLTNGVPIYYPNVQKENLIVITNPPEVHQTVEVHHQHVPHHQDGSIMLIQSPPGAFVEVPHYDPGVQELAHLIDPHQHQQQPYLEVDLPKHMKVRKIRKGYIYELQLTEEEHLHKKENAYPHYPPGHRE